MECEKGGGQSIKKKLKKSQKTKERGILRSNRDKKREDSEEEYTLGLGIYKCFLSVKAASMIGFLPCAR